MGNISLFSGILFGMHIILLPAAMVIFVANHNVISTGSSIMSPIMSPM